MASKKIQAAIRKAVESLPKFTAPNGEELDIDTRVMRVMGWAEGDDQPETPPDVQAQGIYGLCYLFATRNQTTTDPQVNLKRLYFRQAVSYCRHYTDPPPDVAKLFDDCMDLIGLPTKYDWQEGGREIITTWAPGNPTLFMPLAAAIEGTLRAFFDMPDTPAEDEMQEWASMISTYATLIGYQCESPYHGERIRKILGCIAAYAEMHNLLKLHQEIREIARKFDIQLNMPEDADATVRELQVAAGLRSASAKPTAGWRERRRQRRKSRARR